MSELHDFLTKDHQRLDALLALALRDDGTIDYASYDEFRRGLLWHIGVEERILFPEVRKRQGDSEVVRQLHRDHAALAGLLVPPPTAKEVHALRAILVEHNPLEEDHGGLYELVEKLPGLELDELMARVRSMPPVPLAPHADTEITRNSIAQLLRDAARGRRELGSVKRPRFTPDS